MKQKIKEKCFDCNGKGKIPCPSCDGTGKRITIRSNSNSKIKKSSKHLHAMDYPTIKDITDEDIKQAENMQNWMGDNDVFDIDAVLEFLVDEKMLNKKGKRLAHTFWEKYVWDGKK